MKARYRCLNGRCPQFGAVSRKERCPACGWGTHRLEALFDVPKIIAGVLGGALLGWAARGAPGALVGALFGGLFGLMRRL